MESSEHDSAYSWARLALSVAIAIVGNAGMWAVVVVLPAMQAELGLERADATLPYVAAMIGFALGNLLFGRAVDRYGISPVLIAAALALAIGFSGAALAGGLAMLTLLHLALGLGASASFGPLIADVSQWFYRRRGIAVAIAASGNYLSGAVWPPILVWVMTWGDWRSAYIVVALCVLALVVPGALFLRRNVVAETTARAAAAAAHRASELSLSPRALQWMLGLAGLGCCVAMSMPQVHIVALCIDRGFGVAAGAEMLSLMLLGGVVSRMVSGIAADRFGGLPVLFIGSALQMFALSLFLIDGGPASLYVVSALFGLSQGGIVPAYAMVVREYMQPAEAGRRVGFVIGMTILGMALGGWITGVIHDATGDYAAAIWNGIGWNLMNLGIVAAILLRLRPRPRAPTPA